MTWLGTNSGKRIDLFNPDPNNFTLEDIAMGLSRVARFNGQTKVRYSVAEHSINVASLVPPKYRLQALLHDAAEAYICDVPSPLKKLLGPTYSSIEERIASAIGERFGIDLVNLPACVKQADHIMLITEHHLLQEKPCDWLWDAHSVRLTRIPWRAYSADGAAAMFKAKVLEYAHEGG